MLRRVLNNELERMWHKVAVTHFEVLLWYLAGMVEESRKKCSRRPCRTPSANLHGRKGVFALTPSSYCLEPRH